MFKSIAKWWRMRKFRASYRMLDGVAEVTITGPDDSTDDELIEASSVACLKLRREFERRGGQGGLRAESVKAYKVKDRW